MTKTQDKQAFISETSPIAVQHDNLDDDEVVGTTTGGCGCGCFHLFCFGNRTKTERIILLQQWGEYTHNESSSWLIKKLKDLKEFSEVVAGPKWKNFIREFSKRPNKRITVFQYDAQSYALNFNDSCGDNEGDGFLGPKFSNRFAPPSSSIVSDPSQRPNNNL